MKENAIEISLLASTQKQCSVEDKSTMTRNFSSDLVDRNQCFAEYISTLGGGAVRQRQLVPSILE